MLHLIQAASYLKERAIAKEQMRREGTIKLTVDSKEIEIYLGISRYVIHNNKQSSCLPCSLFVDKASSKNIEYPKSDYCQSFQPKVSIISHVKSAIDGEIFICNRIFVDGDSIVLNPREFDFTFYTWYVDKFIETEAEFVTYLRIFDSSFRGNEWYIRSSGGWLNQLINSSKWNNIYLKIQFSCLQFSDGLTLLQSNELVQYGYEQVIRAFRIKYADTSKSIITDKDIAIKMESWIPLSNFSSHINALLEKEIENFKTRKKTYFDYELKVWKQNDGSLKAREKIFFSQFKRQPELEAKQKIIKDLIRKAENEVRLERGFTAVGTLINESLLYKQLKKHFSQYTVISQYRPKWLGRQSLDIYIDELKVALEYQGDQHSRPIEFYGGAEAYEKTKQRDQIKRELCRRNGCRLIYVYPGYKLIDVIKIITT